MSEDTHEVVAARIEAERRRGQLIETAKALQARLSPRKLGHDAWEGVKHKGAGLAEDAVDAVKARPLATAGIVAAITMFLAREPLKDLAGNLVDGAKTARARRHQRKRSRTKTEKVDDPA